MNDSNPNNPAANPTPSTKKPSRRAPSSSSSRRDSHSPPKTSSFATRRICKKPQFAKKVAQMRLRLSPLVNLRSGKAHPKFPPTLLAFWLLTEETLDDLAHFYDQRTPNRWSREYPCPIQWVEKEEARIPQEGAGIIDFDEDGRLIIGPPSEILEVKRRRWGRFMGLRGCESPVKEINVEARRTFLRERMKRLRRRR